MKRTLYGDVAADHILLAPTAVADTNPHQVIDEMANFDGVGYVLVTTGTLAGAWTFQGIDGYRAQAGFNNSVAGAGVSGDISSLASPAPGAILSGGSSKATQIVPCMWGAVGITFTATSGAGNIAVYRVKKGYG